MSPNLVVLYRINILQERIVNYEYLDLLVSIIHCKLRSLLYSLPLYYTSLLISSEHVSDLCLKLPIRRKIASGKVMLGIGKLAQY